MTALSFKAARIEDLTELATIWNESWISTGVESPELLSIDALAARLNRYMDNGGELFVVEQDSAAIGLILIYAGTRELSQLFLAPSAQGRGYGRACLDFVRQKLPGGFWLTVADANLRAIRFYETNGLKFQLRNLRIEYDRYDLRYAWAP